MKHFTVFLYLALFSFGHLAFTSIANAGNKSLLTYQGRILKADGSPVDSASVAMTVQILSPDGCVLWQEVLAPQNFSTTKGAFSVAIGAGANTAAGALTWRTVFQNGAALGAGALTGSGCSGTYTPSVSGLDDRTLYMTFNDGSGNQTVGPVAIKSVMNNSMIGGFPFYGNPSNGQVAAFDGTNNYWYALTPTGGGSLNSVGLAVPGIFSVGATSPVTGAGGTITMSLVSQSANTFWAAPAGAAGNPSFRTMAPADITTALPAQGGNAGKFIQTDGAGNLSWQSAANNPMTTLGDIIYGGAAGAQTRLAANGTATNKFLTSVSSGAPTWNTLATGDMPTYAINSVMITNAAGTLTAGGGTTSNTILQGSVTGPVWSTATYPSTTTANQLLYSSAVNTVSGLPTAANGVLITSAGSVPSISSTLPAAVQGNITSTGTITSGAWNGTAIGPTYGGTNQTTYTTGDLLYASAANTLSKLPVGGANQVLTVSGGVPSWQNASSGTPAGANTQIQYNNAGAFGANSNFSWDNTNSILVLGGGGSGSNNAWDAANRALVISGNGSASATSNGLIILSNNRATATVGDTAGVLTYSIPTNGSSTADRELANITSSAEGAGGANGFGGTLRFYTKTNNASWTNERMRINSSGNVGIGTTSPTAKLQIGSGQILVPDGSAAAPSVAFTTVPGTGWYLGFGTRPSLSAGGSMVYEYSGGHNFSGAVSGTSFSLTGIPILQLNSPQSGINLIGRSGSTQADGDIAISPGTPAATSAGSATRIYGGAGSGVNQNGGNAYLDGGVQTGTGAAGNIILGSTRGNIGIGTASPRALLDVGGVAATNAVWTNVAIFQAQAQNPNGYSGALAVRSYKDGVTPANRRISLQAGDSGSVGIPMGSPTDLILQLDGGNVGIGTASPTVSLDISSKTDAIRIPNGTTAQAPAATNGMLRYDTTTGKLRAVQGGAWTDVIGSGGVSGSGTTNYLPKFSAASTLADSVMAESGGKIGIGNASPNRSLDILSATASLGLLRSGTLYGSSIQNVSDGSSYDRLDIGVSHNTGGFGPDSNVVMSVKSGGYVGIGTTAPGAKLDITSAADTIALKSTGYSLTGANAQSMVDLAGTWNTTGTPTLLKANVVDTASNAASLLMDLQVGGVSKFKVDKTGKVTGDGSGLTGLSASAAGSPTDIQINTGGALAASANTFNLDTAPTLNTLHFGGVGPNWANGSQIQIVAPSNYNSQVEFFNVTGGTTSTDGAAIRYTGGSSDLSINAREAAGILRFLTANTERMRIDSTGNVGIGTTAPNALFDVNAAVPIVALSVGGTQTSKFSYEGGQARLGSTGGVGLSLVTNNNDRMTITSAGNVGIGTAGALGNLQIDGASPNFVLSDTGQVANSRVFMIRNVNQALDFSATADNLGSGQPLLKLDRNRKAMFGSMASGSIPYDISLSGYLGGKTIGVERASATTGGQLIVTAGGAKSGVADAAGGDLILSSGIATGSGSSKIQFQTAQAGASGAVDRNPATQMTIDPNGNVGIGTASPAQRLHTMVLSGDNLLRMDTATKAVNVLRVFDTTGDVSISTDSIANAFIVKSAGNIGMGTTSPATGARLDITGTGAAASSIIIPRDTVANRPTVGVNGMIRYASDTNKFEAYENGAWTNVIGAGSGTPAGATTQVQFNNAGAFGASANLVWDNTNAVLSINSPSGATTNLGVKGNANYWTGYFQGSTTAGQSYGIRTLAGTNSSDYTARFINAANTLEYLSIRGDGNVGIGTSAPDYQLTVDGGVADVSTNKAVLKITNSSTGLGPQLRLKNTGAGGREFVLSSTQTSDMAGASKFAIYDTTAVATRMVVDSAGNVGIGTATPAQKLDVSGIIQSNTGVNLGQYRISGSAVLSSDNADGSLLKINAGGFTNVSVVSGNVGIGTASPSGTLDVRGDIYSGTGGANYRGYFGGSGAVTQVGSNNNTPLAVITNSTERVRFDTSGNVGIGTTSPAAKLDVQGAITSKLVSVANPAGTGIDWSGGNIQYSSVSCLGATWTVSNMAQGATYTFVVQGNSHTGTCAFSDGGSTFKYQPANAAPSAAKDVIYSMTKVGTVVYVSWIDGW